MLQIRQEAFAILQDRAWPFTERIAEFQRYMTQVQAALDGDEENSAGENTDIVHFPSEKKIRQILGFYRTLDFLDPVWKRLLKQAESDAENIAARGADLLSADASREYEWEHVAVYLLFRYCLEAIYDGDILTRAGLVCHCLELLAILAAEIALQGGYTTEKRDTLLRMFSREVEYCPENMEAVCEAVRAGTL